MKATWLRLGALRTVRVKVKREMTALPEWIDIEAWDGFVAMRKTLKKPLTNRAEKLILYTLYRIRDAGHCPNAALDASTVNCWCDVFISKKKDLQKIPLVSSSKYLDDQAAHMRAVEVDRLVRKAKRTA